MPLGQTSLLSAFCRRVLSALMLSCFLILAISTQSHAAMDAVPAAPVGEYLSAVPTEEPSSRPDAVPCECMHTLCSKVTPRSPELAKAAETTLLGAKPVAYPSRVLLSGVIEQPIEPPRT